MENFLLVLLFLVAGITAYLLAGINPAIVLARLIYHQDIREQGSKNPGFTNFKRVYGMKWAWLVMVLDLGKCAFILAVFQALFTAYADYYALTYDLRIIGVTYTTLMASIGHDWPVWYGFKGGKAFLVNMAAVWFFDWRAGLVAFALLCLFLFTLHYMSLATMIAILGATVVLLVIGAEPLAIVFAFASALLMVWRHKENIKRLIHGNEKKFYFKSKKQA